MRNNYNFRSSGLRQMKNLLPKVLEEIETNYARQPIKVLQVWPEVIGAKLASMAVAESFKNGVLFVRVTNSALYSLLVQHEKIRLLNLLQKKIPNAGIGKIVFKAG